MKKIVRDVEQLPQKNAAQKTMEKTKLMKSQKAWV